MISKALLVIMACTLCFGCTTDMDCSLGGNCVSGHCKCFPTWTGESCGTLNLGVTYKKGGYHITKNCSWGGSVIYENGVYHMFASEFVNQCGLMNWETNSQVVHAVSDVPQGPYTFRGVALPTEHHNPTIRKATDGTYLLFCIGENYNKPANCNKKRNQLASIPRNLVGGGTIVLAYSQSLDGPWKILDESAMIHGRSGKWDASTTNPAPVVLSNGTVLLYYRGSSEQNGKKIYQIGVASAPSWKGPYTRLVDTSLFTVNNEDPFVWQSTDGHFHMLTHYFGPGGGHAWSPDGVHWKFSSPVPAYNNTVLWDDHTTTAFGRRERPQVLIQDGVPVFLFNGVTPKDNNNCFTIATAINH